MIVSINAEVKSEQKHRDDDHRRRALHFFARRRGDLLHLGAHIVVEALGALRPRLELVASLSS